MGELLIPIEFVDLVDDSNFPLPLEMLQVNPLSIGLYDGCILTYSDRRFYPITEEELAFIRSTNGIFRNEYINFAYIRPPMFRRMLMEFPAWRADLHEDLRTALQKNDREIVATLEQTHYKIEPTHRRRYYTRQREKAVARGAPETEIARWASLLEDLAFEEQIEDAYRYSVEHTPHMLYVRMEVNGAQMKAFVDSGAQSTIMSAACAERCGLKRLIDTRYRGIARGVGSSTILGRIHAAKVKLGSNFIICPFTVVENVNTDILLGLDQLKKHQMCIDLRRNCLSVAGEDIPFLPESEIPVSDDNSPATSPVGARVPAPAAVPARAPMSPLRAPAAASTSAPTPARAPAAAPATAAASSSSSSSTSTSSAPATATATATATAAAAANAPSAAEWDALVRTHRNAILESYRRARAQLGRR